MFFDVRPSILVLLIMYRIFIFHLQQIRNGFCCYRELLNWSIPTVFNSSPLGNQKFVQGSTKIKFYLVVDLKSKADKMSQVMIYHSFVIFRSW